MFTRALNLTIIVLGIFAIGFQAGGGDKDKKDTKDKKDKKFEIPKDAVAGKVKSVDSKAASFTITLESGKDRTFVVTKETEFWGPKGGDRGTGPKGLEDDCMAKGYDVKVAPAKDAKIAKDVFLSVRKKKSDKADERAKLQGEWLVTSVEPGNKFGKGLGDSVKGEKLVVKGNEWIPHLGAMTLTFKIDATKNPKQLDLTGLVKGKELTWPGIYKIEGDTLTLCQAREPERPTEFKAGPGTYLMVAMRAGK